MTLPDFMDYKDKFTQRAFVEKISHVAKRAGAKMVYTCLLYTSGKTTAQGRRLFAYRGIT